MTTELQQLVNKLGETVSRSVAIDDPQMRLLAYSRHFGPVDETRLASVLDLEAPEEAVALVKSQGVAAATAPVYIPPQPAFGLLPRLCVPIRDRSSLLGYIWLIETDDRLDGARTELVVQAASAAAVLLRRDRLVSELQLAQEQALMSDLLSDDGLQREHAAHELLDGYLVSAPARVCCIALQAAAHDQLLPNALIDLSLSEGRRRWPLRHALQLGGASRGVLVLTASTSSPGNPTEVANRVAAAFYSSAGDNWTAHIGIGGWVDDLTVARISFLQARHAARVGQIHGIGVTNWDELGVYRTLARFAPEELTSEALPPGLLVMLANTRYIDLVATVECFLDQAGNVKSTSECLMIHRTSLYHRLKRVEQIAGIDLSNGMDRLGLHLGIKMARLGGLIAAPPVSSPIHARRNMRPPS